MNPTDFKMERQKSYKLFKEKHYLLKAYVLLLRVLTELSQLNVHLEK